MGVRGSQRLGRPRLAGPEGPQDGSRGRWVFPGGTALPLCAMVSSWPRGELRPRRRGSSGLWILSDSRATTSPPFRLEDPQGEGALDPESASLWLHHWGSGAPPPSQCCGGQRAVPHLTRAMRWFPPGAPLRPGPAQAQDEPAGHLRSPPAVPPGGVRSGWWEWAD